MFDSDELGSGECSYEELGSDELGSNEFRSGLHWYWYWYAFWYFCGIFWYLVVQKNTKYQKNIFNFGLAVVLNFLAKKLISARFADHRELL